MANSNNPWGRAAASTDDTAIKLRASCDACNAAKVRCNKVKLGCGRCERLGIMCVYGLSRRSHRSAPRVGDSSPLLSSPLDPAAISDSIQSAFAMPIEVDKPLFDDFTATFSSAMSTNTMEMDNILDWTLNTSSNVSSGPASVALGPAHKSPGVAPASNVSIHERSLSSDDNDGHPDSVGMASQCSCTGDLFKKLASMVHVGSHEDDQAVVWEVFISNLRQAINISESCINCSCIYRDEFSIVIISVLVGRILQGFETVLSRDWPLVNPTPDGMPSAGRHATTTSPLASTALSCGMLQIEPDEEHDMKQHLLLLQFRKLQRVLEHLRNSLHQLSSRQGSSGNHAHLMTCQFMHVWLTQKAGTVREKYFAA